MSKALAQIDSDAVAKRTDPEVTECEAELRAKECGFSATDLQNLKRVAGKREVGKYLQEEVRGSIATEVFMDRGVLDDLQKEMMGIVKYEPGEEGSVEQAIAMAESKIAAATVVTTIMSKKAELHLTQLKLAEIGGKKPKKFNAQPIGPPRDAVIPA